MKKSAPYYIDDIIRKKVKIIVNKEPRASGGEYVTISKEFDNAIISKIMHATIEEALKYAYAYIRDGKIIVEIEYSVPGYGVFFKRQKLKMPKFAKLRKAG